MYSVQIFIPLWHFFYSQITDITNERQEYFIINKLQFLFLKNIVAVHWNLYVLLLCLCTFYTSDHFLPQTLQQIFIEYLLNKTLSWALEQWWINIQPKKKINNSHNLLIKWELLLLIFFTGRSDRPTEIWYTAGN